MPAGQETAAEILQRAEMRDAWLGVLLPVAVATLLVLVLIILRQRRQGSTALDGVFRPRRLPDVESWWRERRARVLEREQRVARLTATEAEQRTQAADKAEERRSRKILGVDGSVFLQADQRILVETLGSARDGTIAHITDAGIAFYPDTNSSIEWAQIRRISIRHGSERKWWIPITLALVGGGLLGYVGSFIDALGGVPDGVAPTLGWLFGAFVAGGLGTLIMYAFPGPTWITLVEAPPGTAPLTLATFAARAEDTARART